MSKQYPNLPGVNVKVLDGQLTTATSRSANSILIIAEAKGGKKKVEEGPVYIANEKDLYSNFGGFFHQGLVNPIAAQWLVAYKAGVNNIYLMALRGETKKEKYINLYKDLFETVADLSISHIVLDGLYADDPIEGLQLTEFNFTEGAEIQLPTYKVFTGTKTPCGRTCSPRAPGTSPRDARGCPPRACARARRRPSPRSSCPRSRRSRGRASASRSPAIATRC